MDYKTILVYLDQSPKRSQPLALGLRLAERFEAHLTALLTLRGSYIPMYPLDAATAAAWAAEEEKRHREAQREAKRAFQTVVAGFASVRAEFRVAEAYERMDPARPLRVADLVVAAQPETDDGVGKLVASDLLLSAGRPVLFVPYAGDFRDVGRRVLIAWNGSREAARAVADALPILRGAEAVDIITFDRSISNQEPNTGVAQYLARHGVNVSLRREPLVSMEIGEVLLSRASDFGSDLIVMGGYGHSRVRERLLGGATRALLDVMTVPVLMSH